MRRGPFRLGTVQSPAVRRLPGQVLRWGPVLLGVACAAIWIRSYVVTDYVITAAGGGRYCFVLCYWGELGVIVADPWPGVAARRWVVVHGDDSEAFPESGLTTPWHSPWPKQRSATGPQWVRGEAVTASDTAGEPFWPPEQMTKPIAIDPEFAAIMGMQAAPPAVASPAVHFGSAVMPLWLPVVACAAFPLLRIFRSALRHDVGRYRRRRFKDDVVESP